MSAKDLFDTYSKNYDAQTLRIMVKNILDSMSPTAVRPSGGCLFRSTKSPGQFR